MLGLLWVKQVSIIFFNLVRQVGGFLCCYLPSVGPYVAAS